ncbi:helix-turn-helix domain-containing protein [Paenarthrobacter sp. NPDC057981]|uniref:helix-turn-helix domain-containing protein n=1 Tax=Paenarthrobacter sp. NPDC057981 TaxID=3346297 RepID=UPI0036D9CFB0
MALFMDISRDDDETVLSVVVGCDCHSGARAIYVDLKEAQQWAVEHARDVHPGGSTAVQQIGDLRRTRKPKPPTGPRGQVQDRMLSLLREHGTLSTKEVSELSDKPMPHVNSALRELQRKGKVTKERSTTSRLMYWTAAEELLEAS